MPEVEVKDHSLMHHKELSHQNNYLRWMSLATLLIQNCGLALTMRYSRISSVPEETYITTTAVFASEVLKLIVSSCLCFFFDCEYDLLKFKELLIVEFIDGRREFVKLMVPSGLYVLQNNLQYIAADNLSAQVYLVLSNMKIVSTAFFSVIMLGVSQSKLQWCSIASLVVGVCIVQIDQIDDETTKYHHKENENLGLICVLTGACTSGFAGVYFEKVLKSTDCSIWLRNMQLALIGIFLSGIMCYTSDRMRIYERGFFFGYDILVCVVISLAAFGGLIVAAVVKYADNILKGFATSGSIVITSIVSSMVFHDSTISFMFVCGAMIVCGSSFTYSYKWPSFVENDETFDDETTTFLLPQDGDKMEYDKNIRNGN